MQSSTQLKPEAVLLDLDLSGLSGLEAPRLFKKQLTGVQTVMLLNENTKQYTNAEKQAEPGHT